MALAAHLRIRASQWHSLTAVGTHALEYRDHEPGLTLKQAAGAHEFPAAGALLKLAADPDGGRVRPDARSAHAGPGTARLRVQLSCDPGRAVDHRLVLVPVPGNGAAGRR